MKKRVILLAAVLMLTPWAQGQAVFSEDFQGVAISGEVGQFPDGWTTYGDSKTNVGNFAMFGSSWCVSEVETGNNAAASVSYVTDGSNVDRWMVTPAFTVPSSAYKLIFRAFSADVGGTERLRVMVSTTGVEKEDFTTTLRDFVFDGSQEVSGGWNSIELPLEDFVGQAIHIAFVNHGNGRFVFVDDIEVSAESQNLHMALLENFTSQQCGNCPSADRELESAYNGLENRVAWLSHHAGFANDDYTISESLQLEVLYGTGSTYAPALMIDRSMNYSDGNPGPVHYVGTAVMMHQVLSRASSMVDNIVIGFTGIHYDAQTRQLQATVEGYFIADQSIEAPRLTVYLAEDSLIGYQSSASNNYRHDHVVRACLTSAWGDDGVVTSTDAGATFSKTVTYTLPVGMRADKCYLVACVNNYGSSAAYGREVYNTAKSGYITDDQGEPLGVDDFQLSSLNSSFSVFPNPATSQAYLKAGATIRSLTVTTIGGSVVMTVSAIGADMVELDVEGFPEGLYLVRIVTDDGIATVRLAVVHRR